MTAVETVFFDMDGLMFDTEKIYFESNAHVLNKRQVAFTEEDYSHLVGASGQNFVDLMMPFVGDMDGFNSFLSEADAYFMDTIQNNPVPVKKGLFDLLDYLKENDADISVVSSSNRAVIDILLSATGVDEYVSKIVSADDVSHTKPHPEPYLMALEKSKANPEKSFVIEDSNNGILSAKNADIKAIMVPDLAKPIDEVEAYAELIADDLHEVKKYFENLIK